MRVAHPPAARGLRVGLLGGSFNPPHAAHRLISRIALARLGLDAVWWLVTPGNPLKDNRGLPPLDERLAWCRMIARHPRIHPTAIEAAFGTRYTADTLAALRRRWPSVRFVWLMGADNLAGFHHWRHWRRIAALMPIAVLDREGETLRATAAPAALALASYRRPERDAPVFALARPPAWLFLHGPRSGLSSTRLRQGKVPLRPRSR